MRASKIRVMVAADDPALVAALADAVCQARDLDVVGCAYDALQATRLAWAISPHVILMGASIPGRDWILAAREITNTLPETRIVAVSRAADGADAEQIIRVGAVDYVAGEAPAIEIRNAILRALDDPVLGRTGARKSEIDRS